MNEDLPIVPTLPTATPPVPPTPPAPVPGADMFASVDPVATPPPASPRPLEPLASLPELDSDAKPKKLFVWLGIVVAVLVVGIGGWFAYKQWYKPAALQPGNSNVSEVPAAQEEQVPTTTSPLADDDFDRDGLTNAEEQQLGTDPYSADTDGDGLYDRDEAAVWHTDPLNADSDGDSYLDGAEVSNGFNPRGEGKLLELPTSTTPEAIGT